MSLKYRHIYPICIIKKKVFLSHIIQNPNLIIEYINIYTYYYIIYIDLKTIIHFYEITYYNNIYTSQIYDYLFYFPQTNAIYDIKRGK